MTEQISQLIESVFIWYSKSLEEYSRRLPVSPNTDLTKVPTLLRGHYEVISPMLYERYKMFGTWLCAPYGDWLSLEDMEGLWIDWSEVKPENSYVYSLKVNSEVWDNDVIRLFRPERISAFAINTESYERVYLMWFDSIAIVSQFLSGFTAKIT
ncbi:MAG: hypothetical protein J0I82_02635 [Spirosoma sp.]|uniref:hypothetical protein n=1 Tax=unclassified Spirosoma TaxID=2621999 RepID=UPI000B2BBA76|nr:MULTISPECIES: hypothetical protein [unclassified Spirosoma]MBN8820893.1 hypothetical protein [Spirosoma sp.]